MTAIWVSLQVGRNSGTPVLAHALAFLLSLRHPQSLYHTCHVQADCEGMGKGLKDGPGQTGPQSRNTNIHPLCPPGYSVAVGEFSGDDTEGECVPRLGPRKGINGNPGPGATVASETETLTIFV